jgi:hypothetical protein
MAGGKRVKMQDTRIQFLTSWAGDSPSLGVTAVTKANPAVLTVAAGFDAVTGSVARVLGAVGMTELNGELLAIEKVDGTHFKALNKNSTDYGAYTSGGKIDLAVFSTLCELTGFNQQGGSSPEIPATTQCSDAAEFEIGLPDFGTVQVDFNYAPDVTIQQAIEAAYLSGNPMAYRITFLSAALAAVSVVGFGFVQQMSKQVQVGGLWTGSFTMRSTGRPYTFGV